MLKTLMTARQACLGIRRLYGEMTMQRFSEVEMLALELEAAKLVELFRGKRELTAWQEVLTIDEDIYE